jgi:hypothetical protein
MSVGRFAVLVPLVLGLTASPVLSAPAFVDVTTSAGLNFVCAYGDSFPAADEEKIMFLNNGNGVAAGDYDNDGDLDLYVCEQWGRPNRLFRNNFIPAGTRTFTDVTPATVADRGQSRLAVFIDFDNDGARDLLVVNDELDGYATGPHPSRGRVYEGHGNGTFTDRSTGSGVTGLGLLRCGAAIADYDRDGRLDLFVTNWSFYGTVGPPLFPGSNRLYRCTGAFQFSDVTAAVGLGGVTHDSYAPILLDFDGDRWQDLYVATDHRKDRFYWNRAASFVDASVATGIQHIGNDMGVAVADFDNDDDVDLYTTNITDPDGFFGTGDYNCFYVNRTTESGGTVTFVDEAGPRGVRDTYWGWGTDFLDVENDGDLDLVACTGFDRFVRWAAGQFASIHTTPSVLFINDGTGHFARVSTAGLEHEDDSRSLLSFDFDRDGDMDILTTNVNQAPRLYENRSTGQGRWLHVRLNTDLFAVGATVFATTGSVTRRWEVLPTRSFLTGLPLEAHFGLGSATTVNTLRVRWSDGYESVFTDVATNQILDVSRGALAVGDVGPAPEVAISVSPNPSHASVRIQYMSSRRGLHDGAAPPRADLVITDAQGRLVRELAVPLAGSGVWQWDGTVPGGRRAGPGTYFFTLRAGGREIGRGRVVLTR